MSRHGITAGGPLLQCGFRAELLKRMRGAGINCADVLRRYSVKVVNSLK